MKLVDFFTSCGQSEKIFRGSSASFVTAFKIILKLVDFLQVVGSQKKYLEHSGSSASLVTSFKIILKLVEYFTSCGQ